MNAVEPKLDIAEIRRRLSESGGRRFWSSLEEIIDQDAFRRWIEDEFPAAAQLLNAPPRRDLLKLMCATLLLAGAAGCGNPRPDLALPYVIQPEGITPGIANLYATAVLFEGYAQPVLATTYAGRPTKLDGNPEHPITRGASDIFMQSAVWQLYDPDRSRTPLRDGLTTTWARFEREVVGWRGQWREQGGDGLHILTGNLTSPTAIRQLQQLQTDFPQMRLYIDEPVGDQLRSAALRLAFGRDADQHLRLDRCDVVVSLDDDLLGPGPRQVMHGRQWAERRGDAPPGRSRLRMHVAESTPSLTGVAAATRHRVDASQIDRLTLAIAAAVGVDGVDAASLSDADQMWVNRVARELEDNRGTSLFAVGAHLPPAVQALGIAVNARLGNIDRTVWYGEPVSYRPERAGTLADLAQSIASGHAQFLVMLGSNPAYVAPARLDFARLLPQVEHNIHCGLYQDETAALSRWHLPLAHALESWSDARAVDGTATIIQPLVGSFFSVRTVHQVLDMLLGSVDPPAEQPVRITWQMQFGKQFESRWRRALHDGFVENSAAAPISATPRPPDRAADESSAKGEIEIVFRPDPCVWDGRFATVAWLQEMPKPLTKVTWDNAILVSPQLAERLNLANGELVEIEVERSRVTGPAWVMPGQAANTVTVFFGYGRARAGTTGSNLGYSAYRIRPAHDSWIVSGQLRRVAGAVQLATTQLHHRIDGFDLVREVTPENPTISQPQDQPTLYPTWPEGANAWGMVIDLDLCIGCNACVAACDAENNIPVVGKEQVAVGREMHWLRVDRYYTGPLDDPQSYFQPVPCMHCEKAPCEMGCPVHATVHNHEGLNQMVYNRCIGTRTCSSYCPYKVRRFNWYDYRAPQASPIHAAANPDVTVRSRGVMEKCTYCTQRIEAAHVAADKERRAIREGEVTTACQQACPTTAIVFGNLNDPTSAVAKRRNSSRHYALLDFLGTRPRTTYLARWNDDPKDRERS